MKRCQRCQKAFTPSYPAKKFCGLRCANVTLQRTVDAIYATLGDNERLQVELQVARRASTVLQAELRAAYDRSGGTEDYVTVLRKLVKEEHALTARLTRRAS